MEILALQRQVRAADLPLEQLASNKQIPESVKLAEASRQFEAVLLRQILTQAQKTVFPSKLIIQTAASGVYQDLITSQLAESISRSGSFGLAAGLEKQLQQQLTTTEADKPAPAPPESSRDVRRGAGPRTGKRI
jgi:Rod binding domain-containing protein